MRDKLFGYIGKATYYLGYPLLLIYLRIGKRTRLIVRCNDEILLLKGWVGNNDWSLPGGGRHRNEEPTKGVIRETLEETNIKLVEKDVTLLGEFEIKHGLVKIGYFLFETELASKPKITLQKNEIKEMQWVPIKELTKHRINPDAMEAIEHWRQQTTSVTMK